MLKKADHSKTSATRPRKGTKARLRPKPPTTKKQTCIDLLRRPKGASLAELKKATGWQAHSVRGFLSGTVQKMPGVTLVSEKPDGGARRYRVTKSDKMV